MSLVNMGSYLCSENILMESNFANILIKYLDDLFVISKLKGGYYEWGACWDSRLKKEEISLAFYEGSEQYDGDIDGVNLLVELDFYIDNKGFCDTIKLFANREELLEYGFNSEKEENRIKFESATIKNEHELKRALEFAVNKI